MDTILFFATLFTTIGSAIVGGIMFAFSNFIMKALGRMRPEEGTAAMQAINITVINPLFMLFFLGTALVSLPLAIFSVLNWSQRGSGATLAGSLLYLFGVFGVTMGFNVPRNDALARVDPAAADSEPLWRRYVAGWTRWNHVRTLSAIAAATAFALALMRTSK